MTEREISVSDLEKLAKYQRFVIYSILATIILLALFFVAPGPISLISMALYLFVYIFQLYSLAHLSKLIGWSPFGVIFGLLFPIVNFIILLLGSDKATKELRKAGIKVGFLGVSAKQMADAINQE